MQEQLRLLAQQFNALNCLTWTVNQLVNNKKVMALLNQLLGLMRQEIFFQAVLDAGFTSAPNPDPILALFDSEDVWNSASPIAPMLYVLYELGVNYDPALGNGEGHVPNFFECTKDWDGSSNGIDNVVNDQLVSNAHNELKSDEKFFGATKITLTFDYNQQYHNIVEQLVNEKTAKASALFFVADGTYTESLFVVKDGDTITTFVASDLETDQNGNPKASHIHDFTTTLMKDFNIPIRVCAGMKVIHDGDCAIHSEINCNALLYKAWENNSMYDTLKALEYNKFNLCDSTSDLAVLAPERDNKSTTPNSPMLVRWLTHFSRLCINLELESWLQFCQKKQLHPFHAVKTDAQLCWPIDKYRNWVRFSGDMQNKDKKWLAIFDETEHAPKGKKANVESREDNELPKQSDPELRDDVKAIRTEINRYRINAIKMFARNNTEKADNLETALNKAIKKNAPDVRKDKDVITALNQSRIFNFWGCKPTTAATNIENTYNNTPS